ncbi:hypothetical protein PBI_MAKEMAKE_66 [Mycobacterium phage Makemake]|uniref:hypothetical protein n=1 Tax=Mycobacterium phage Makemake TaxID=1873889 RepID=UPI00080F1092|nr:hypothetical protein BI055_gp66 [Mycobacterium phage Makemake]ANT41839.1 hypothetical protein PBI_MAKEMAKE_66 [Mycobacterium phage Makemake]
MNTAIIAQTRAQAADLALNLGMGSSLLGADGQWAFGADDQRAFEGIRAARILTAEGTQLSDDFLDSIYACSFKTTGGRVFWVSARDLAREDF